MFRRKRKSKGYNDDILKTLSLSRTRVICLLIYREIDMVIVSTHIRLKLQACDCLTGLECSTKHIKNLPCSKLSKYLCTICFFCQSLQIVFKNTLVQKFVNN